MSLEQLILPLLSRSVPCLLANCARSAFTVSEKCAKTIDFFCQHLSNEKENFGKDYTGCLSHQLLPPW